MRKQSKSANSVVVAVFILSSLFIGACSKSTNQNNVNQGGGNEGELFSKVDVNMASLNSVVLAPDKGFVKNDSSFEKLFNNIIHPAWAANDSRLFGVTKEDKLIPINISKYHYITSLTKVGNFIFLSAWGVRNKGIECYTVALRKSDGALFCVPANLLTSSYMNANINGFIQKQPDKDIYFFAATKITGTEKSLFKLDFSGETATMTTVAEYPSPQILSEFVTNSDGDLLVMYYSDGSGGANLQIRKSGGGLVPITSGTGRMIVSGTDNDSTSFYAIYNPGSALGMYRLPKSSNFTNESIDTTSNFVKDPYNIKQVVKLANNKVFAIKNTYSGSTYSYKLYQLKTKVSETVASETDTTLPTAIGGKNIITKINSIVPAGDKIIVLGENSVGNSGVVAFDGASFSNILYPEEYSISKISFGADRILTFNGVRNSDSAKVLGELALDGKVTIRSEKSTLSTIQEIVRLN